MPPEPPRPLRLVSYNILYGGQDRVDRIAAVLRALEPDIVGFQEANEPANIERLADLLGMHAFLAPSKASPFHVALLSRERPERTENLCDRCPGIWRSVLRAEVPCRGETLGVVVLHLAPGRDAEREAIRMTELDAILPVLDEAPPATVMMGDFNSTAPYHPHLSDGIRTDGSEGRVPRDAVRRIVETGWIDAIHRARPAEGRHSVTTTSPASRLDYIWLRGGLETRLLDAAVEQGTGTVEASDHFPVWATLRPRG